MVRAIRELDGHEFYVASLAWSPDGNTLVSVAALETVRWWDVRTGKLLRSSPQPLGTASVFAAFSPDGKILALLDGDCACVLQDATSGREIRKIDDAHCGNFAFSPDGTLLAIGSYEPDVGTIRLVDVATGKDRARFRAREYDVEVLAFSHDGKFLASGSYDTTVLVWDVQRILREKKPR